MHNKRLLLYIPILLVIVVGIFGLYEFKLQQLVNEGVSISNEQCKVYAFLDIQNKIFQESTKALLNSNKQEYLKKLDEYFKSSKQSVSKQKQWLFVQKNYINKWDYNLLPSQIQKLVRMRYEYWRKDTDAQQALIDSYNLYTINNNLSDDMAMRSLQLNKERDAMLGKMNTVWNEYKNKPDWRMKLVRIPQNSC